MNSGDLAWVLVSAALVWVMTPGLALFYGGLGERRNLLHTMFIPVMIIGIASLVWFVVGYTLSFGGSGNVISNFKHLFLTNVSFTHSTKDLTIPDGAFALFQGMFPIITAAIITGSVIGRVRIKALLVFIALWLIFMYSPLAHMVWGGGFLAQLGAIDFAGGTVVHISSGVTGLVLALMIGHRHNDKHIPVRPSYVLIGGALLWVGWFGFNSGSALAANGTAVLALVNTWLASAAAVLTWGLVEYKYHGRATLSGITSGGVAGLVAITPAAGFVAPWAAVVMGLLAGFIGFAGITFVKNSFGYDDTLDAFGIHGIGGAVGAILTGVFADKSVGGVAGLINGNISLVGKQLVAILFTIAFSAIGTYVLARITELIAAPLRLTADEEAEGYDTIMHDLTVE
ncbi:ammonium transporter [Leuconostoc mesenteroides]|uniref:Ammonium transporter n=1 Tax=Leuconostoc mesenteroides subsp. cremoris ATCC 19254 TaxID=586220 RepID=C2KKJ3_LEUMC|nr:ammonium transporter [Leuconostoc mesenteroides]EQC84888.1 ammonia permease [Leuconostoc mesenteroides subsp. cremoris TIFN8]KDA51994.1 Ammonium transporter [Leuconostoc mesenteroides subsp. cremoris T26]EEJ42232.1 ammonium transporter [Leuconostoc mesenteroides subsp. cremoris ATCC 19254]MDG9750149.1 ammonium transporter [Leuconostoc mesenteroides]ORI39483.1 ammonia permease [Leuconostoc mesenteroides subsp. cremoris]